MFKNVLAAGLALSALTLGPAQATGPEGADLVEMAARPYIQFREDIDYVGSTMPTDASMMREAHLRMASHDQRSMAGAWIAYAAMVAADTPEFAAEIERRASRRGGKEAFINELETNPAMVRNMPGADAAVAAVMRFAASDAAKIREAGDAYIASAYDMQKVAWARREIAERGMDRVDAALAYAAKRRWPSSAHGGEEKGRRGTVRPHLYKDASWSTDWSGETRAADAGANGGVIVTKALVLGARYALDDVETEDLAVYGTSKRSERCFTNAKLNLDQCIAATRTPYEEAFCLGQHALNDTSSCVGWPAGTGVAGS